MSLVVTTVERNVRKLLWDVNDQDYAIDPDQLRLLLVGAMHKLAGEVGMGPAWETGAVTLAASDYDYTLTSTIQYQSIMAVRHGTRLWILERVTPTQLLELRSTEATGDPQVCSLFEEIDQEVILWVYPTPGAAGTLDILRSQVPDTLDDDTDTIPFSDPLLRALEMRVAAVCFGVMPAEERERLGLGPDFAQTMIAESDRAVTLERRRKNAMRKSATIPIRAIPV